MTDGLYLARREEFWKRIWKRKSQEARRRLREKMPLISTDPWGVFHPWVGWEEYWDSILRWKSFEARRRLCLRRGFPWWVGEEIIGTLAQGIIKKENGLDFLDATGAFKCLSPCAYVKNDQLKAPFVTNPLRKTLSDSHLVNMGLLKTSSYDSYVGPHGHSSGQEEAGTSGVQGCLTDHIRLPLHTAGGVETSKQGMETVLSMLKERDHLDGCYNDRQVLLDLINIIIKVGSGITALISAGTVGTSLLLAKDSELYFALQQHGSLPYLTISAFGFGVAAIVAAVMSYIPIGHIRATVQYIRRASRLALVLLTISFISLNAAYIVAGITVAKYHPNKKATITTIGAIPFLVLLACFLNVAGVKRH